MVDRGGVVEQYVLLHLFARIIVFGILSAYKPRRGLCRKRQITFHCGGVKFKGILKPDGLGALKYAIKNPTLIYNKSIMKFKS